MNTPEETVDDATEEPGTEPSTEPEEETTELEETDELEAEAAETEAEEPEAAETEPEAAEAEPEEEEVTEPEAEEPEVAEVSEHEARLRAEGVEFPDKPEGPIAAAILAGGIGCFALGAFTTLAEASTTVKDWLDVRSEVGPLSGKTVGAVVVWLVAWAVLHVVYREKPFETRRALTIALVLVALGVVGTFPTFFQLFTPE